MEDFMENVYANTNPFELGLERLVDLEMEADVIGKKALKEIAQQRVSRRHHSVLQRDRLQDFGS